MGVAMRHVTGTALVLAFLKTGIGLNALKARFGDRLAILGVPSANFANQEPTGDPVELMNILKYARPGGGFVPKFPIFKRVDVNGANRIPLYKWALRRCPFPPEKKFSDFKRLQYE